MATGTEAEAVVAIAAALGLGPIVPVALGQGEHPTFRLGTLPLVARLHAGDGARAALARELRIACHLADRDAPVIRPAVTVDPGPHAAGPYALTLWDHVPHRPVAGAADARAAAVALRRLHEAFASYADPLPPFTAAIDGAVAMLADAQRTPRLSADDRAALLRAHARLMDGLDTARLVPTPLHGDAHPGNALITDTGALWCDLEAACRGPREWDVACLPPDAWTGFPDLDPALLHRLSGLRSLCVAAWCWAAYGRNAKVDEAAGHHLAVLRGDVASGGA